MKHQLTVNGQAFSTLDATGFYKTDAARLTVTSDSGLNRAGTSFTLTSLVVPPPA